MCICLPSSATASKTQAKERNPMSLTCAPRAACLHAAGNPSFFLSFFLQDAACAAGGILPHPCADLPPQAGPRLLGEMIVNNTYVSNLHNNFSMYVSYISCLNRLCLSDPLTPEHFYSWQLYPPKQEGGVWALIPAIHRAAHLTIPPCPSSPLDSPLLRVTPNPPTLCCHRRAACGP